MERFETTGLSKINLQMGALTCCEGAQPNRQSLYRCRLLGFGRHHEQGGGRNVLFAFFFGG